MRRITRGRRSRLFVVATLLVVLDGEANLLDLHRPTGSPPAEGGQTGLTRTVQTATSTARQGAYYLPSGFEARPLPLMVIFHGTGGKGSLMIARLQALAEREGFMVLAPDSVSVAGVWSVGPGPDPVTEDYRHVMNCVREVLRVPGVRVDPARVLAAGFSVGGSVAPYLATRESLFTAFAVLHGHVVPGSWGRLRPRAWLSTGDRDRARTVEYMRSAAGALMREGFPSVELRVFKVDHRLGDGELAGLVAWWLGRH
jgi:poly(3-hydroxybutyrate) depolymerase